MELFNSFKLENNNGEYIIILYLNSAKTEFSDEFGHIKEDKKKEFCQCVVKYFKDKFPELKISVIKVMVGSVLISTIPLTSASALSADTSQSSTSMEYVNYTVTKGDTLWKISEKFGVSVDKIKILNNIQSNIIYINQILKIPTMSGDTVFIYEIKAGDTLYKISTNFNTTIENLKKTNNLISDDIYVGQKLKIHNESEKKEVNVYIVAVGDTLWKIANNYNTTVDEIKNINNLSSNTIYIGQNLKLPKTEADTTEYKRIEPYITYITHQVKAGENMWSISIDYGIPMTELMQVNGLNSNSVLSIGQALTIPVHNIPIKPTMGAQYGENLEWWSEAQYIFPINKTVEVTDFYTKKTFTIKRTIGANHADCEPLTAADTAKIKDIWGGIFSWKTRPVLINVDGRKIAASMSFMPHGIQYIENNNFSGHFDIHFLNSTRHKDGEIDYDHQEKIKIAAGMTE